MAISHVQSAHNAATTTTPSATFSSAPAEGNVLVCFIHFYDANTDISATTNWTLRSTVDEFSGSFTLGILTKTCGASESSTQSPCTTTNVFNNIYIMEFSGADESSILDTLTATSATGTSLESDTATNFDTGDLVLIGWSFNASKGGGESVTDSFTHYGPRVTLSVAYKISTDGGDEDPTLSWNTSRNVQSGGIVIAEASSVVALSGAVEGAAALTGDLGVVRGLSASFEGTGEVSGDTSLALALSGAVQGAGTVTGAPSVAWALSGAVAGAGTVEGAVGVDQALSGAIGGAGSVAGVLGLVLPLSGAVSGSSVVEGGVVLVVLLSGEIIGVANLSGQPGEALRRTTWFEGVQLNRHRTGAGKRVNV